MEGSKTTDWPEPIQWLIDNFEKIRSVFEKIFTVYDNFIAFLDKLKDGGVGLINWIWHNLAGKVERVVGDTVKDTATGVLDRLEDIILTPFRDIYYLLRSIYSKIFSAVYFLPAPFRIVAIVSIVGMTALGVSWLLKRLYELL